MNDRVYVYTATHASTPPRIEVLNKLIRSVRREGGYDNYTWNVWAGAASPVAQRMLAAEPNVVLRRADDGNDTRPATWNRAIAEAREGSYPYFLEIADDIRILSRRAIHKALSASRQMDDNFIVTATVRGASPPPLVSTRVCVHDVPVEFLRAVVPHEFRLIPVARLDDTYFQDLRRPAWADDALTLGSWCQYKKVPFVQLPHVRVRLVRNWRGCPLDRNRAERLYHRAQQHVPYIPPLREKEQCA